jgi:hypothetical protein
LNEKFVLLFLGQGRCAIPDHEGLKRPSRETTMTDKKLAQIRWTISNIGRYRRLLETQLTETERQFIKRRLSEERATLNSLEAETPTMTSGGLEPDRSLLQLDSELSSLRAR